MTRSSTWIPLAALVAVSAVAQPWRGREAEARPGARAATCRADDLKRLRAELATSQAELASARAEVHRLNDQVTRLLDAERRRAQKLADQLGSPMIETLKGVEPPK